VTRKERLQPLVHQPEGVVAEPGEHHRAPRHLRMPGAHAVEAANEKVQVGHEATPVKS